MDIKYFKLFYKILFSSLFIGLFLYITLFILLKDTSNFYICVDIQNLDLHINSFKFQLNYPVSCDQSNYYMGFENMNNIITSYEHPYQNRPLYILFVSIISKFLNIMLSIFNIEINFLLQLSTFIVQVFIVSIGILLILLSLNIYNLKFLKLLPLCGIVYLNPLIKWGIFVPSHQLLTFVVIASGLYILSSRCNYSLLKISIIFGILFLAHRAFLLIYFLYIFREFLKKEEKFSYILENIKFLLIFILPNIFYLLYIRFLGYEPYDAATQYWGQFIWIGYYLIGIVKHSGQWYCQTVPENFICYFTDTLKTIFYMGIPILFSLFNFIVFGNPLKRKNKEFQVNLILIIIILFTFWAFIGWYPPLRFNLYSIGNGLMIVLLVQFIYLNKNIEKILFFFSLVFYFLFLNHWNYENIIYIQPSYFLSILIMAIFYIVGYRNLNSGVGQNE